jgi:hypothetical protein
LADRAKVALRECEAALVQFQKPDKWSRTKDHEGRRIREVDGGWLLLNHDKYRRMMSAEDRREYQRKYHQEYRKRKKEAGEEGVKGGARQAIKEGLAGSNGEATGVDLQEG